MKRVTIEWEDEDETVHLGWFDSDKATTWEEKTFFDGNNMCSLATRSPHTHEELVRTSQGRWVIHTWSAWVGVQERWFYITAEQARDWLIRNRYDDKVTAAALGETPESESGPATVGRPRVGDRVEVRIPAEMLAWIDGAGQQPGENRADTIRRIISTARAGTV